MRALSIRDMVALLTEVLVRAASASATTEQSSQGRRKPVLRRAGQHRHASTEVIRTLVVTFAVALTVIVGADAAHAAGPQVTVIYPVDGTLTSSPLEAPPHHHYWGNFAVDDAAPGGRAVYARFANASGGLSLQLAGAFEPCATPGTGGSGVIVNVSIDGQLVGRVYYAHLSNITRTSGAINNGDQIGTLYSGSNTGCWQGAHTHVEPKGLTGTACYVSRGLGSGVNGGTALGVIGGGYVGADNQTCPAGAENGAPGGGTAGDGSFLRTPDGSIYEVLGGAPIHVDSCSLLNGCPGLITVPNINGYPTVPRDGTFIRIADGDGPHAGLIARVAGGHLFGLATCVDGCAGVRNLDAGGFFDYDRAHPTVADGTFVRVATGARDGLVARVAGGHLIGLATCVDGCNGFVNVDETSFLEYNRAHPTVADGTFVRVGVGQQYGLIARAAGAALLGLISCEPLDDCRGLVNVDQVGFDNYVSAHPTPRDGTVLKGLPSGGLWRIADGHRTPQSSGAGAVAVNDHSVNVFPLAPCPTGQTGVPPACVTRTLTPIPVVIPASPAPGLVKLGEQGPVRATQGRGQAEGQDQAEGQGQAPQQAQAPHGQARPRAQTLQEAPRPQAHRLCPTGEEASALGAGGSAVSTGLIEAVIGSGRVPPWHDFDRTTRAQALSVEYGLPTESRRS